MTERHCPFVARLSLGSCIDVFLRCNNSPYVPGMQAEEADWRILLGRLLRVGEVATELVRALAAGGRGGAAISLFTKGHRRRPGEVGNVPAPLAYIRTPLGNWMQIPGETAARALFRKGLRHVLRSVLRKHDGSVTLY